MSSAYEFYLYIPHRARRYLVASYIELLRRSDSDYVVKELVYSRYEPSLCLLCRRGYDYCQIKNLNSLLLFYYHYHEQCIYIYYL